MAAASYRADNLVAILDHNKVQATGTLDECMNIGDPEAKFAAFGWHVIRIDGHDVAAIADAFDRADTLKGVPVIIIADTIKGKYISFAEGKAKFHNCSLTREEYHQALRDIDLYEC